MSIIRRLLPSKFENTQLEDLIFTFSAGERLSDLVVSKGAVYVGTHRYLQKQELRTLFSICQHSLDFPPYTTRTKSIAYNFQKSSN